MVKWTIASNAPISYGYHLDGSPYVHDNSNIENGGLFIISITDGENQPLARTEYNAWYEPVEINGTAINPDNGKLPTAHVGQMSRGSDESDMKLNYNADQDFTDDEARQDFIDQRTANIDTWNSFDNTGDAAVADLKVFYAESSDGVFVSIDEVTQNIDTWSDFDTITNDYIDFKEFQSVEANNRYFKFKAELSTQDPAYNIRCSALSVTSNTL